MKYTIAFGALLLALLAVPFQPAQAQDMPVPTNLQAAIFKKVFSLNKTLVSKGNFNVLVVHAGSGNPDEIVQAFAGAGITATAASASDVPGQIDQAGIVYLMPGSESVSELSRQKKVFTITGAPAIAESGKASVGLGLEGGKPKILVHMAELQAEGQEVSADLLKLARVIQ